MTTHGMDHPDIVANPAHHIEFSSTAGKSFSEEFAVPSRISPLIIYPPLLLYTQSA